MEVYIFKNIWDLDTYIYIYNTRGCLPSWDSIYLQVICGESYLKKLK